MYEIEHLSEEELDLLLQTLNDYVRQTLDKGEFQEWYFHEITYAECFFYLHFENSWTILDSVSFEYTEPVFYEGNLQENWLNTAIQALHAWEQEMING